MIISATPGSKRIPTILGIVGTIALVVTVAFTVRGAGQVTQLFSRADTQSVPTSVGVANISDTGATVYWITDQDSAGSIFYGRSAGLGDGVAVDDRDLSSQNNKYPTHMVHLNGLKADTKYFFKIGVGTQTFGDPDKNSPFEFTTGSPLALGQAIDPIFGKVTDSSGAPSPGVIVVWNSPESGQIAALAKTDGSYVLPIGNARSSDLKTYLLPVAGQDETINLYSGDNNQTTKITCKVGQDRPLPTVKLGESVDCSKNSNAGINSGFRPPTGSAIASPSAGTATINIKNGETVSTPLPTISGKAGPNQVVKIEIHSETPYSGTVQADASGNWSWTPPANLSPGEHTVTISIVNANGTTQTITRTFTVSAGTSILPITSGTPSAQLTHLACVSSACSTVTGIGPNTCATDADCAPAPIVTPIATPTPRPIQTPPQTGSTENTLVMLTLGFIFATLGGVMLFKKNGSE